MIDWKDVIFVDIDTQFDFMAPDGALYVPGAEEIKPVLKKITEFAVKNNIPIIGSVDAHSEKDPEFKNFPPHCIKNTPGYEKIPETKTENMILIPNEEGYYEKIEPGKQIIFEKQTFSIFDNVNLDKILKDCERRKVIIYGVATEYCVKKAAEGFVERGYTTYLLKDAIKGIDKKEEEKTIENLKSKGVKIVTFKDFKI
ncbi:MAG: hypothetical protein DRP67_01685 [Candidatus Omnitrophota bacterium]|nr:MAG: hypothetical protein DRP67_01685 [Candidatus Omnitrophota bacterium]